MKLEWLYTIVFTTLLGLVGLTYNNLLTKIEKVDETLLEKIDDLEKEIDILNKRVDDHQLRLVPIPLPCNGDCPLTPDDNPIM